MGPNAQYYQRHRKTARNYTTVTRFENIIFGVMGNNFQHFLLVHMLLQTRELHNRRPWARLFLFHTCHCYSAIILCVKFNCDSAAIFRTNIWEWIELYAYYPYMSPHTLHMSLTGVVSHLNHMSFTTRLASSSWWRHQMETFSALLAFCAWSPVNSPHKGQWRGALMFSLICTRINGWANNGEAGHLRRYRTNYDVTVMLLYSLYGAQGSQYVLIRENWQISNRMT